MKRLVTGMAIGAVFAGRAAAGDLVRNGTFEEQRDGAPAGWQAAGDRAIRQTLSSDAGSDGGRSAKLECAHFEGTGPSAHVMLCQAGSVGVTRGKWYRLTFRAKAEGMKRTAIDVALSNTRVWANAGLSDAFVPSPKWEPFEMLFQAVADLPADASRLQFWFKGTGTLWLDDVSLVESDVGQQWFPRIATEGVTNLLPNSSFECGGANWGSYTYGLSGWAGNLYRLEGEVDAAIAHHGRHSLKIALTPQTQPVFWFDYYDPVRQPVRRVLVANRGWLRVKPGEELTLSAFLRGDSDGLAAQLLVVEAPDRTRKKQVTAGREWARHEFTFTPQQEHLFIAVGLDLEASQRDAGTLWLDAVQLERGERASDYRPRQPLESFLETAVSGNVFTTPRDGATFAVRAYNDSKEARTLHGTLAATDFFDRRVFENETTLAVPAGSGAEATVSGVCTNRLGFLRASWTAGAETQSLRCAIIEPSPQGAPDSPLGFNHAYPWQFLTKLARDAGIVWWRDWSAKWQTVEPQAGKRDWSAADAQINRVRELDGNVEVLLPFASTLWNTTATSNQVAAAAGASGYLRSRLPVAFAPARLDDFGAFAAEAVRRYGGLRPRPVTHFQVLNEPVYTDYALPRKFGYSVEDYVRFLEAAARAMKAADPQCRVVGGISANIDHGYTREFVEKGGLRHLDVFDLHLYDVPSPAESYDESFRSLAALMREHGGPKPVWISEWGCYADDDPACVPQTVGDAAMNRCKWRSERAATEHIVKFTAVSFAHGVRKIFFHAGTCGAINGPDAGGVLFEYGGAPRKMYAGVSALTRLLGVPDACVKILNDGGLYAAVFRAKDRAVAVAWATDEKARTLKPGAGTRAFDVMGNERAGPEVVLGASPLYFTSADAGSLVRLLGN